jgi:hypothetical protein
MKPGDRVMLSTPYVGLRLGGDNARLPLLTIPNGAIGTVQEPVVDGNPLLAVAFDELPRVTVLVEAALLTKLVDERFLKLT